MHVLNYAGFHEETCSFGVMKKGVYRPSSDFNFEFVDEVICSNPLHSGYCTCDIRDEPCNRSEQMHQIFFTYSSTSMTYLICIHPTGYTTLPRQVPIARVTLLRSSVHPMPMHGIILHSIPAKKEQKKE